MITLDRILAAMEAEGFDGYRTIGFTPLIVDVHSRRLTEDEFIALPFIFYREAWQKGHLAEYLERERRFQALFATLSEGGVSTVHRDGTLRAIRVGSRRLRQIVLASTRDWRFMDIYLHGFATRAIGNFDQSVILLVADEIRVSAVIEAVRASGLYARQ